MQMKTKKSCGPDNISSFILKIACPVVSKSLAKIFNASLETGIFPEVWKLARVAPIFKTGVKSDMSNYQPISVLSTVARVFEKIVYEQLYDYFEKNRFLTKYQSGFRRFHSTVTAMLKNTNGWLLNMDKGHYNGVILFDLKKAFDTIDHGILKEKLKNYGIQNTELAWFGSYLLGHKQYCSLNGVSSETTEAVYGIPQGSCLGPLLFLIFINDLPLTLKNAEPSIFADDTSFTASADSIPSLLGILDESIESLKNWMTSNKLTFNTLKTEFLVIASRTKVKEVKETLCVYVQGEPIYRSPYAKSLGFYIDQQLDWEDHVTHVVKKCNSGLSALRNSRGSLPKEALLAIYRSLIESHLHYGISVWGNCGDSLLTRLQKIQNRAARIITGSDEWTPSAPLLETLGWKNVRELYRQELAIMVFKSRQGKVPEYLSDLLPPSNMRESKYELRYTQTNYNMLRLKTNMRQRSFSYQGAKIWNNLKTEAITATSLQSFKKLL